MHEQRSKCSTFNVNGQLVRCYRLSVSHSNWITTFYIDWYRYICWSYTQFVLIKLTDGIRFRGWRMKAREASERSTQLYSLYWSRNFDFENKYLLCQWNEDVKMTTQNMNSFNKLRWIVCPLATAYAYEGSSNRPFIQISIPSTWSPSNQSHSPKFDLIVPIHQTKTHTNTFTCINSIYRIEGVNCVSHWSNEKIISTIRNCQTNQFY